MDLISFSLYGANPKYLSGIIKNSELIRNLLPSWQMRVYCGTDVPKSTIESLIKNGCQIQMQESDWHPNGMFWRYLPIGNKEVRNIAFRDADSRISSRDVTALEEWLASKLPVHIIRDHPFHQTPILGGLWGINNDNIELLDFWSLADKYSVEFGEDQRFLRMHIYPIVRNHAFIHDDYFAFEPKSARNLLGYDTHGFMGESFSEYDVADLELREIAREYFDSYFVSMRCLGSSFLQAQFNLCKSKFVSQRALSIPK